MRFLLAFLFSLGVADGRCQSYPQGYFRNPLGIHISLAGNFGECRPGHFHMGLDLKTEGRENLPVYASADGFVSRIKTEPGGFGHAIYLTHPNGYTTVYAHLNDFFPALQKYLRSLQYGRESWTVDESLKPEQFPVKKGQQIAWSGNTGGSTAPHLHFEIRDTKTERALNPQLFGFEIKDTRAPVPTAVALYDLRGSFYAGTPVMKSVQKTGNDYAPAEGVLTTESTRLGVGIVVDDFMDGSTNTLAFLSAELYVGDVLQTRITLDDIGYDETRYLHAYADYGTKQRDGRWVQCLFRLPGNNLTRIYESGPTRGILNLDTDTLTVRIVLRDAAGNESVVRFSVRQVAGQRAEPCGGSKPRFSPAAAASVEEPNIRFTLPARAVYDDVCFMPVRTSTSAAALSERYVLGSPGVPVHSAFALSLKPSKPVPFAVRLKTAVMYTDGKATSGKAATPETGGWYTASVRAFGYYWLAADTGAPVVKPVGTVSGNLKEKKSLAFSATDATTSVKSFRGEVDGKWVLFEQHGDVWTYIFDEHCPPGKHTLTLRAVDEVGNETRRQFSFVR